MCAGGGVFASAPGAGPGGGGPAPRWGAGALCGGEDQGVIFVPNTARNCDIQAGCAGQAGAVTRLPSV
ncbi:hypothetical protein EGU54_03625 [Achromobacter aegrifaciens]|nr:hypothetical protein EGU54_03625 [Achromobacter aegrifaciens]